MQGEKTPLDDQLVGAEAAQRRETFPTLQGSRTRFLISSGTLHIRCGTRKSLCRNTWLSTMVEEADTVSPSVRRVCRRCFRSKSLSKNTCILEERDFMHIRSQLPKRVKSKAKPLLNAMLRKWRNRKYAAAPVCKEWVWQLIEEFRCDLLLESMAVLDELRRAQKEKQDKTSVLLLGNGPVSPDGVGQVDAALATGSWTVACCNRYDKNSIWKPYWRCDLHFLNPEALENKKTLRLPGHKILLDYIPFAGEAPTCCYNKWSTELASAARQTRECTRGFYAACLACKLFDQVIIVGFGGDGHANNPKDRIAHNVRHEHAILERLADQSRLRWIR